MTREADEYNERMIGALRESDVLSVFFVRVGRSMILDLRREGVIGPAIMLDDIVSTPQARLQSFRRLRPGLPLPDRLTLAPWTAPVREFKAQGLLEVLLDRCQHEGGGLLRSQGADSYSKLETLEHRYLRDLVRGYGMETIWQRSDP